MISIRPCSRVSLLSASLLARLKLRTLGSTVVSTTSLKRPISPSSLFAKLKDDTGLQEKLQGAADLDAAIALAKEAGFDVSKADWLKYEAKQTLELSDEELEGVAGGRMWWRTAAANTDEEAQARLYRWVV